MSQAKSLTDISLWREQLGLLPVPLYPGSGEGKPFVLLNGSRGNFCLDTQGEKLGENTRSVAWSSNVSHYVSIAAETVEVQRWDQKRSSLERYSYKSVQDNLIKFQEYLEEDAPSQELSIVSHAIRVFRTLRATLGSKHDGTAALKAFLCLLASTTDNKSRGELKLEDWQLSTSAAEVAETISEDDWISLQNELLHGRSVENLETNLTLLLRHAAGQLFQEAHYQAVFFNQSQLVLPVTIPAPVAIKGKEIKNTGLHFTPPALARTLVEETLNATADPLVIFDPACGSGEFLREALRQLELSGTTAIIKVTGWDISEAACDMARFVLAWEKRHMTAPVDVEIRCIDSLSDDIIWPNDVGTVFMNPPFVSWQDMTMQQRATVANVLSELKEMRPDLSHAFLLKASTCLRDEGMLGTILPASVLDGDSSAKLRRQLNAHMSPKLIARLGSQFLFPSAIIDASLYVGQRTSTPKTETIAFWADHRTSSTSAGLRALRRLRFLHASTAYPVDGKGFDIYKDSTLGHYEESWSPRPYQPWATLQSLAGLHTAKDLFDIEQGVRTGYNPAFILSKEEWSRLPKAERIYFRPAVVNRSIRNGVLEDTVYVFYPYGTVLLNNEEDLVKAVPRYYAKFLSPSRTNLHARAGTNNRKWWELTRHRSKQVEATPKIVSTYFGDAGSFAYDASGDFVTVQGYSWLPKKSEAPNATSEQTIYAYLAIVNSRLFSTLLAATSNQVGGGQWNLSTKFVSKIPMPDLFSDQSKSSAVSDLEKIGEQIHDGLQVDETHEELVRLIYGLGRTL